MGSAPRVSVIVPLHDLRAFVAEAIESALAQTLEPADVEVVVVDDGSTDGGGDVARRYLPRIRYLRQDNRGLPGARNSGIRASAAPVLLFLDADDRIRPEMLATALGVLDTRPEVDLVCTGFTLVDAAGAPLPQRYPIRHDGDVLPHLVLGNMAQPNSVVVRRGPVEEAGGFDETLRAAEDWDLWLRLSRRGVRWASVDRPLAEYRIRATAMHQDPARMLQARLRVLDKVFSDASLPREVARARPLAYQNAYLVGAGDYYQAGDPAAGARWFRAAATARPLLLTEPESLALFCRWLLPMGYQTGTLMSVEWHRLARTLRAALTALFRATDLEPEVARLRWPAEIAYWKAVVPFVRTRARAAFGGRRRARLEAQRRRLRTFEREIAGSAGERRATG